MLRFDSFVHRDQLADTIARWMVNKAEPGDVRTIKSIINFNSYAARMWSDGVGAGIIEELFGEQPRRHTIRAKGELKDYLVAHPTYRSPRIDEMIARYLKYPEDFYREAPIDGCFYTLTNGGGPTITGGSRIKRFRRIAEKGARYVVDFMLDRIRLNADLLARQRADARGVSLERLVSSDAEMIDEFEHAERRVIKSIKQGTIVPELKPLGIPDVVGIKLIVESDDARRLIDLLDSRYHCRIIEAETHTGTYNATNLRVSYRLPKDLLLRSPPAGQYLNILRYRGFDPATVATEYRHFIETAEDTVSLEVIVSGFEEFMESEIGRSMHEERVQAQRTNPGYKGHLATNVRYLMTYILGMCRAPGMEDVEVPIKLWVKYMPDSIEYIMRALYLADDMYFDTVAGRNTLIDLPTVQRRMEQ